MKGLEEVDQDALQAQYLLAEALWSKLIEQGVRSRSQGRIEAYLFSRNETSASSLVAGYVKAGWLHEIEPLDDGSGKTRIKLVSALVYLTREAFLELVDVMMISAHNHGCAFDGFQVEVSAVVPPRPWWHFW